MSDPRRNRLKAVLGVTASVVIAALALYVLYQTFQRISVADVIANMRAVPRDRLLLAAACAAGAFATLAAYEVAAVRYVKRGIGRAKPVVTALVAFPLGHALGQTVLSGGALRYRMYAPAGMSAMCVASVLSSESVSAATRDSTCAGFTPSAANCARTSSRASAAFTVARSCARVLVSTARSVVTSSARATSGEPRFRIARHET